MPADQDARDGEPPLDPESFNTAYEVLRRNAEALRDQAELDIDRLVPLVEQSMQAYRICRSRLDAVRLALESRLGDAGGDRARADAGHDTDDDVPRDMDEDFDDEDGRS